MTDMCRRFDRIITRWGQLTAEQAVQLGAHLAGCGSCRSLAHVLQPMREDAAFAATGVTLLGVPGAARTPVRQSVPASDTGRYQITGEVGRGGIGRVLHALDRVLERPVAVKELFSTRDDMRRRFMREALITARLQHPSIVPVYDAGQLVDASPFYAMKLVAGQPLDDSITEATTLAQRLALLPSVLAVADAIAYAHNERVIHRDLKPNNVLVGKYGETVVIDWGLAKDLSIDDRDALDAGPYRTAGRVDQTIAGTVLGTPGYMAPEQACGNPVDERADVYALGAILYHVVSGKIPHEGTTIEEMVHRVIEGDVRPLLEREPEAPRDLAAIVHKAMALDPAKRYPNAQGLADDLRRFQTGQLVASHTYRTRELLLRWVKRHRGAVSVALASLVLVSIIGVVSFVRVVRARHAADEAALVASQQEHRATEKLADMQTEQGRQELLAGRPARAAVYLNEAQAQSHDPGIALRSLLAHAMRSFDAQQLSLEGHGAVSRAEFSSDGSRILTAGSDGFAKIWNPASGAVVATLTGHKHVLTAGSFSPDDSRVVTVSHDHTAKLWDALTGQLVATLDHPDEVWFAAFSPDGTSLIVTGKGGIARLWDTKALDYIVLRGHRDGVFRPSFSADGRRVITASADRTAKVWDARTGRLLLSLEGHRDEVHSAAFSRDGSQIVTASYDRTARLWDARTGRLLHSLEGHTAALFLAAYSPDGTHIVTTSFDHTAKLWDARNGKLVGSLVGHTAEIRDAAFSPDSAQVVTASFDHTLRLWDVPTAKLLGVFEGHRDTVISAVFSPDGRQILSASWDGAAKLWDAKPIGRLRVSLHGATDLRDGLLSLEGGERVVTVARHANAAKLWDARSGKLLFELAHRGDVIDVDFDAHTMRVVTASDDGTTKVWNANTGTLIVSVNHPSKLLGAMLFPDGQRVLTIAKDHGARIWNASTGELTARLDADSTEDVLFGVSSKDSTRVFIASPHRGTIWSTDNGKLVATIVDKTAESGAARFSEDGEWLVTGTDRQIAKVWNARTGALVAELKGHNDEIDSVSFSRDGARVLTGSADRTAKVWDARTGKLLASLDGHAGPLKAIFSPDREGARVLTASADHTVKVWDTRSGKLLASLDVAPSDLLDYDFSPDGSHVLTMSSDGTIWSWDVHLEQRNADEIGRIVRARAPWTLQNGGLVPVLVNWQTDPRLAPEGPG